jgi:hypothetical protein
MSIISALPWESTCASSLADLGSHPLEIGGMIEISSASAT